MKRVNMHVALGQLYRELTHVRRFKQAVLDPRQAQEKKLLQIIKANTDTVFGKEHGFSSIKTIADYQRQVPAWSYESLEPYIQRAMAGAPGQLSKEKPLMYATTSGTTGKPKFIPITESHLRDYTHAFHVHHWGLTRDKPDAVNHPGGKYLIFNSNDEEGLTQDGTPYGAVSGLLRRRQSNIVQAYFALPALISRIKNIESKYYSILRLSLCHDVVAIISCNPSTLLLLSDQLKQHAESLIKDIFDGGMNEQFRPDGDLGPEISKYLLQNKERARMLQKILDHDGLLLPKTVWPSLVVLSVWKGGPMPFYLNKLPEKFGNLPIRDMGYMASEGRGTIPLTDEGAGGVCALTSHFFEFVAEDEYDKPAPQFLSLDQLEMGKRYFIYFTTASGLYRYNINDLMEVVGFEKQTPILQFVQKGMGISSITGEKLTEEQVSVALQYAVRQHSLDHVEHFIMSVKLEECPYYCGFVETGGELSDSVLDAMSRTIDLSLQLQNIEYKDKRQSGRLGPVRLMRLPCGTFRKLRQQKVSDGAPEAQVKIPFLTNNTSFGQYIAKLADAELSLNT